MKSRTNLGAREVFGTRSPIYSRFVTELSGIYNGVAPLSVDTLKRTGGRLVLDLGSGAAGPRLRLQPPLRKLGMDDALQNWMTD